jgi:serine protease Do
MNLNNNFLKLKTIAVNISIFLILLLQSSCDGCSPSGRRSRQKSSTSYEKPKRDVLNNNNVPVTTPNKINSNGQSLNALYNKYRNSVFMVYTSDGINAYQGSGFFISKDGLALSNYHVFEGTSKGLEIIETLDKQQLKIVNVVKKSKEYDYIVFRVQIGNYNIQNPLPISTQTPEIGEDVFAIGNPRGLESTLSKGIVSALRDNNNLIQTTTEITHGSSGGPLINMKGEVIGITTAGLGEANLNFAVNIKALELKNN